MGRTSCVALVLSILLCAEARSATNIGVVLDNARAASAKIGAAGGTLTASAANGTLFTLTIPQNALANDETITMTPVAQTTNLPFSGGMVAAVQLEPRGLRLFQLATLTISTPTPIPIGAETPLAWHGDGSDMYLHPLLVDPSSITFKLIHFSGAGVANGTSAERDAQIVRVPCDLEAALMQRLMPIVQAQRDREKNGLPPDPNLDIKRGEILGDYYLFTIRPMMAVALQSKDDDSLWSAVVRAMTTPVIISAWYATNDPLLRTAIAEIADFESQALKILSDNAFNRCVKEHKPEEIVTLMRLEFLPKLLGISIDLGTQQKLDQCGSLELVFESIIIEERSEGGISASENMHARSTIPIRVKVSGGESGAALATAPLRYVYQLTATLPGQCTITSHGTDDTFAILDMQLNLNPKKAEDVCKSKRRAAPHSLAVPNDEPAKTGFEIVSMTIDPGHPMETASVNCPDGSAPFPVDHEFAAAFETFHFDEEEGFPASTQRYKIEKWVPGSGELLAQRIYNQDASAFGVRFTEESMFQLFHRPTPANVAGISAPPADGGGFCPTASAESDR